MRLPPFASPVAVNLQTPETSGALNVESCYVVLHAVKVPAITVTLSTNMIADMLFEV